MKLYMAVTADEYELPMLAAETTKELAEFATVSPRDILFSITRKYINRRLRCKFIRVEVEDNED